jgi:hypothetical protein
MHRGMRFSISAKRITVLEVFKLMKLQHEELGFFYNNDLFDPTRKVDVNVSDASLDELMSIILGGKYAYELQEDHIVIKPLQKSNLPAAHSSKTVTGLVKDQGRHTTISGFNPGVTGENQCDNRC